MTEDDDDLSPCGLVLFGVALVAAVAIGIGLNVLVWAAIILR